METNSKKLFKGFMTSMISISLFFIIIITVAMTPGPNNEINYILISIILVILLSMFVYGTMKIDQVCKFLVGKEKENEVLNEPAN
jgi:TRAP-type C4-dicarboxylate transport system permease large subunit